MILLSLPPPHLPQTITYTYTHLLLHERVDEFERHPRRHDDRRRLDARRQIDQAARRLGLAAAAVCCFRRRRTRRRRRHFRCCTCCCCWRRKRSSGSAKAAARAAVLDQQLARGRSADQPAKRAASGAVDDGERGGGLVRVERVGKRGGGREHVERRRRRLLWIPLLGLLLRPRWRLWETAAVAATLLLQCVGDGIDGRACGRSGSRRRHRLFSRRHHVGRREARALDDVLGQSADEVEALERDVVVKDAACVRSNVCSGGVRGG